MNKDPHFFAKGRTAAFAVTNVIFGLHSKSEITQNIKPVKKVDGFAKYSVMRFSYIVFF